MRTKKVIASCYLNEKNKYYLQKLDVLDGRTGKLKKTSSINLSELLNHALSQLLESRKDPSKPSASGYELELAYRRFVIAEISKEIAKLQQKQVILADIKGFKERLADLQAELEKQQQPLVPSETGGSELYE